MWNPLGLSVREPMSFELHSTLPCVVPHANQDLAQLQLVCRTVPHARSWNSLMSETFTDSKVGDVLT